MDNGDGAKSQCDYFAIIRSYCCCCCPCAVLLATFGHISDNDETGELPAQAKQAGRLAGTPDPLPLLCACWHYIVVVAASGCSWLLLLLLPDLSAILKVIKIARKSLTSGTNTRSRAQLDRTAPTPAFPFHCSRSPPPTHHICLFSELPKQQQQQWNNGRSWPSFAMDALSSLDLHC